tara:strand:+ start:401 stop:871 length:471 start_codon:yes stop_codon:yes gene_type:complete
MNYPKLVNKHDDNPNYYCSICKDIFDPDKTVQLECLHLFCESCIDKINSISIYPSVVCPLCSKKCRSSKIKDVNRFAYNLISDVKVYCPNGECDTITTIGNLNTHLTKCDYNITSCPYCEQKDILRKDLKKHIVSNLDDHLMCMIDDIKRLKKNLF